MACFPPFLGYFVHQKVLAGFYFYGQLFQAGPLASRNVLYSGFCGDPEEAPIGIVPQISGDLVVPSIVDINSSLDAIMKIAYQREMQRYWDSRRGLYENAANNGSYKGSVLLYREQHEWRSRVWDIQWALAQAWRQFFFESGQLAEFNYGIQAENWRRKKLNNNLSQQNEETLYTRQQESREMLGNLIGTAIMFTPPAEEE